MSCLHEHIHRAATSEHEQCKSLGAGFPSTCLFSLFCIFIWCGKAWGKFFREAITILIFLCKLQRTNNTCSPAQLSELRQIHARIIYCFGSKRNFKQWLSILDGKLYAGRYARRSSALDGWWYYADGRQSSTSCTSTSRTDLHLQTWTNLERTSPLLDHNCQSELQSELSSFAFHFQPIKQTFQYFQFLLAEFDV